MAVKIRERPGGKGYVVDVRIRQLDGSWYRERHRVALATRSAAQRWAQQLESAIVAEGGKRRKEEEKPRVVPTLAEFWPRFMEGYARANQEKPSTLDTKELLWRAHLDPMLGKLRLDAIDDEQVQRLKGKRADRNPKTVNNILALLSKVLKVAVEWKVIQAMPCRIRLLKSSKPVVEHYEDEDFERLVVAAAATDPRVELVVLLGGDAGLRSGEIVALEWTDVDLGRGLLKVQRSDYKGQLSVPKGGRPRVIPMTSRLAAALKAHRHLRGARVICEEDGNPVTRWWLKWHMDVAERRAGLPRGGRLHILRHTFCSRLASRNVPAITIQHLAGHAGLETTQRYLHLASAAPAAGIRALEGVATPVATGGPPTSELVVPSS
jgi:integrase